MHQQKSLRALCLYLLIWPTAWGLFYLLADIGLDNSSRYLLGYSASLIWTALLLIGLRCASSPRPHTDPILTRAQWLLLTSFVVAAVLGPWLSAPQPAYAYVRLILLLPLVLSGFASYQWFLTKSEVHHVQVMVAFSLAQGLYVLCVLLWLGPYIERNDLEWTSGLVPFFNIRRYTNYFAIGIPAATGIWIWLRNGAGKSLTRNTQWQALTVLALCLLWAAQFWAGSRAPILAFLVALVCIMLVAKTYCASLLKITVFSATIGSVVSLLLPRPTRFFGFWNRIFESDLYESAAALGSGRTAVWHEAWRQFQMSPIFGNGHSQFALQEKVAKFTNVETPHNFPLEMLNDFGLVGGIPVLILVYGGVFHLFRKAARQDISPLTMTCLLALLTMTLQSFLDGNLTNFFAIMPYAMVWALTASSLHLHESAQKPGL